METPAFGGLYHWICIFLTVLACVLTCKFIKKPDARHMRRTFWLFWTAFFLMEVYKQVCFAFDYDGTAITYNYEWYAFPFQFCSSPMYVSLLAALIKNQKIHDALCAYLATFAVFAGLTVLVYPVQCFVPIVGVNIQTMVWHGGMIVLGVYLLASGYVKLEHRTVRKAIPVFACFIVVAMILNEVAYNAGLLEDHVFNMFYISPYCEPSLPVYSLVQQVVPYPWSIAIYVAGFSAAAYLILLIGMAVKRIAKGKKELVSA